MTELLRDHTANLRGGVACCLARLADRAIIYVTKAKKDNEDDRMEIDSRH